MPPFKLGQVLIGVGVLALGATGLVLLFRRKTVPVEKILENYPEDGEFLGVTGEDQQYVEASEQTTTGALMHDAGTSMNEAIGIEKSIEEAKALLEDLENRGEGETPTADDLRRQILKSEADAKAARDAAVKTMKTALFGMNIPIYSSMVSIVSFVNSERTKMHPTPLDTWVLLKLESLPLNAHVREVLGDSLPEVSSLFSVAGHRIGILTDEYVGKYRDTLNWLVEQAASAKRSAHVEAMRGDYVGALFDVGMYDWYTNAGKLFQRVWDQHEALGFRTPTSVEMQASMGRDIMKTLAAQFVPKKDGLDSPVNTHWNNGVFPESIYMAGLFQASWNWWEGPMKGNLGWAKWRPESDMLHWSQAPPNHWYWQTGGASPPTEYQQILSLLGLGP